MTNSCSVVQATKATDRILVVDDDEPVIRPLIRGLTAAGFSVDYASDGPTALHAITEAKAKDGAFAALLADIQMPRMRGEMLQRLARELDPDLAVMLITAYGDVELGIACMRDGASDYVTKPFQIRDVIVRLRASLEKRSNTMLLRNYHRNLESAIAERTEHMENQFLRTLESLSCALEAKDEYTNEHSVRVQRLALLLVDRMYPGDTLLRRKVEVAARLHDIGKIGVPESIINKSGPLTQEELYSVRQHPNIGSDILLPVVRDTGILEIVRHHHEFWDGSGYPDGLIGEQIPLGARILGVVDAFDAMTSRRPYRKPYSMRRAMEELVAGANRQWDPLCVNTFVEMLCEIGYDDRVM